jgi:hypothetical protein
MLHGQIIQGQFLNYTELFHGRSQRMDNYIVRPRCILQ